MSKKATPDYLRVLALVKGIGSKNGFEPIPRDQIGWHMRKTEPSLQRMWAWMVSKTLYQGHWSPYATTKDGGDELHIEHVAQALDMDLANAYRAWKEGVAKGLWRYGTMAEGKRRLYICGSIPAAVEVEPVAEGEGKAKTIVCTDNLPPYICNKIKDWPIEQQVKFSPGWERRVAIRKAVLREQTAVARDILDDDDTAYLAEWTLDIQRQEHVAHDATAEEIEERRRRAELLRPQLLLFVQTVAESVPTGPEPLYQTPYNAPATATTLLGLDPSRQKLDARAGELLSGPQQRPRTQGSNERKEDKQLPAVETTAPVKLPELSSEEKEAADFLFSEFRRMQKAYPNTDFAREPFSPDSKSDQIIVYRVLSCTGAANVEDFVQDCVRKFKGIDRNELATLSPRAPGLPGGPRSFGMIVLWAMDYERHLDEAARATRAERFRVRAHEVAAMRFQLGDPDRPAGYKAALRERLLEMGESVYGHELSAGGGQQE